VRRGSEAGLVRPRRGRPLAKGSSALIKDALAPFIPLLIGFPCFAPRELCIGRGTKLQLDTRPKCAKYSRVGVRKKVTGISFADGIFLPNRRGAIHSHSQLCAFASQFLRSGFFATNCNFTFQPNLSLHNLTFTIRTSHLTFTNRT